FLCAVWWYRAHRQRSLVPIFAPILVPTTGQASAVRPASVCQLLTRAGIGRSPRYSRTTAATRSPTPTCAAISTGVGHAEPVSSRTKRVLVGRRMKTAYVTGAAGGDMVLESWPIGGPSVRGVRRCRSRVVANGGHCPDHGSLPRRLRP